MIIYKQAWHFRVYNWFNKGRLWPVIDLCSYGRTVMFWAPLKAIFYFPSMWLYKRNKSFFYSVIIILLIAICVLLSLATDPIFGCYLTALIILFTLGVTKGFSKMISSDWEEASDTKFVQYVEKTGKALATGAKYSLGLPLKTIFWTIWMKMYNFHKTLFWTAIAIAIGAIFYGLVLIDFWWQVLAGIGTIILMILLGIGITILSEGRSVGLKNSMVWQFLKAQKNKVCPLIELKDKDKKTVTNLTRSQKA